MFSDDMRLHIDYTYAEIVDGQMYIRYINRFLQAVKGWVKGCGNIMQNQRSGKRL